MRLFAAFGIALLLASCASGGGRPSERERFQRIAGKPVANPSAVVKAELAFARLAREKGQWTAFRETAADDAVMFDKGQIVPASQFLNGRADPAQAVSWQPHKIIMSCDGSLALSTGAWQAANGSTGTFVTVWKQQDFGKGDLRKPVEWKWVFDHGWALDEPLPEPDFVETQVACLRGKEPVFEVVADGISDTSPDDSLTWRIITDGDKRTGLRVITRQDGRFDKSDFWFRVEPS